jgi:hypothetical protein
MPLDQLMAMYGYAGGGEPPAESSEEEHDHHNNNKAEAEAEGGEGEAEAEGDNIETVEEDEASDSEATGKKYSELQKLYEDEIPSKKGDKGIHTARHLTSK